MTTTASQIRPYSRPAALAKLDGRTKEARLIASTRRDLIAHLGATPSAPERALIEQACQLAIRIAVMDKKFAATGEMTQHDSRVYLAWANSYSRLLARLGLKAARVAPPTLAQVLARGMAA